MARTVGSYFEKLTSKAPGGRRLNEVLARGRNAATKTAEKVKTSSKRGPGKPARRTRGRARQLPREGVVTVEYSPQIDGDPDPGEVVWAWVPFEEDPEQGKDRPVIVIGRRGSKLVGIPLTTKSSDREAQISIGTGGWDPKRRQSYARIWRMLDLDDQRTRREGAVLPLDRFDEVVAAVDQYYDVRRASSSTSSSGGANGADPDYDY